MPDGVTQENWRPTQPLFGTGKPGLDLCELGCVCTNKNPSRKAGMGSTVQKPWTSWPVYIAESWAAEDGADRQELQVALPLLPRDRRVLGSAAGTKETSVFLHREPGAYSGGHHEPLTSTSTLVALKPAHTLGHLLGETRVDHPTPMLIPGTGLPVGAPCP